MTTAYLTVADAARLLRRKPWPVYQAIKVGELRASQPGNEGPWLIEPADLMAIVQHFHHNPGGGTLGERLGRARKAQS